jgi:hypothetical protein
MKFQDETEGGNPNLVKLKDGGQVYGVLRGDLYEFRQHWVGRSAALSARARDVPYCAKQMKSSFRFR